MTTLQDMWLSDGKRTLTYGLFHVRHHPVLTMSVVYLLES